MNRYCCFSLVFALAVSPHIAEAAESESSIASPSGVRTWIAMNELRQRLAELLERVRDVQVRL